ncbi:unnamed protein product [Closterium sp. NIES-54]
MLLLCRVEGPPHLNAVTATPLLSPTHFPTAHHHHHPSPTHPHQPYQTALYRFPLPLFPHPLLPIILPLLLETPLFLHRTSRTKQRSILCCHLAGLSAPCVCAACPGIFAGALGCLVTNRFRLCCWW